MDEDSDDEQEGFVNSSGSRADTNDLPLNFSVNTNAGNLPLNLPPVDDDSDDL